MAGTPHGKKLVSLPNNVFASLVKKMLALGEEKCAANFVAGFRATERVTAKLPAYANPAEAQQNMPDTIGAEFKAYIDSIRGEDLVPKQKVKRFHLPVIPGKSVLFEVQNFVKAREDVKITKDPSLNKKARNLIGLQRHQQASTSGGAAAKKKKVTQRVQEAVNSENELE
ncbi:hypothetical protein PR048_033082 [Dryococelus australis]|uniref:Uncharacterized protein n=1 Tax=Dryococelus australis TaxID=614101 RepID=A0ABQ9G0I3_9NEOP|nr:hypothetical protein PR048_033082 [Dryococelus australis]